MRNAPSASRRTYGGIKADQTLFSRLLFFLFPRERRTVSVFFFRKIENELLPHEINGVRDAFNSTFCLYMILFLCAMLVRISKGSIFVFCDIYFIFLSALFTGPDFVYLFIEIIIYSYKGIKWVFSWKDNSRREGCMNNLIFIIVSKSEILRILGICI